MLKTDVILVLITVPLEAAETLAHDLVERRLAACVQVVPEVRSTYRWKGAIETATEARLEVKTASDRLASLLIAVEELHPHEVPEFLVIPVIDGNPAYLTWVRDATTPP